MMKEDQWLVIRVDSDKWQLCCVSAAEVVRMNACIDAAKAEYAMPVWTRREFSVNSEGVVWLSGKSLAGAPDEVTDLLPSESCVADEDLLHAFGWPGDAVKTDAVRLMVDVGEAGGVRFALDATVQQDGEAMPGRRYVTVWLNKQVNLGEYAPSEFRPWRMEKASEIYRMLGSIIREGQPLNASFLGWAAGADREAVLSWMEAMYPGVRAAARRLRPVFGRPDEA